MTDLTSLSSLLVRVKSEPLAVDKLKIQEAIVINFAALLGARSAGSSSTSSGITTISGTTKSASAHDFEDCLSDAVNDDDIVCILPSFNLKTDTHNDGKTSPLPKVGEHHHNPKVPEMAASVLDTAGAAVSDEASNLEQSAAQNLGALVSWPKSTLVNAPAAVSKSVSTSFASLVESRVKAWTLLLLRHSLTNGDASSRNRLLSMLSSKIEITGSITSFKTLALPDAARDQPRDADVILPVIFEVVLQVSSQGRSDIIPLRAPGTISGHFADTKAGASPGIIKIEVNLDTAVLLDSMVEQARLVVFKAVARVTAIDVDKTKMPTQQQTPTISTNTSLSGFSSVLNLSAEIASQSPKLQKAQSSALRLNSILQGKSTLSTNVLHDPEHSLDQARKSRSVQWEKPVDPPKSDAATKQIAKRQRMVQSQARLRSMKSFGRPHAEPGNSEPKNATFGDFGRGANGAIWGRDGKLLNHPVPQSGLTSSAMSSLNVSSAQNSNQNATFDFSNSPQAPRQVRPNYLSNLSLSGRNPNMGSPVGRGLSVGLPSTLPRTATALESWLVKNATNRNR